MLPGDNPFFDVKLVSKSILASDAPNEAQFENCSRHIALPSPASFKKRKIWLKTREIKALENLQSA